jgi:hypothetical protein
MAPASIRASASTSPRPRPAPETSTTLSVSANSGRRFLVPRYTAETSSGSAGPRAVFWGVAMVSMLMDMLINYVEQNERKTEREEERLRLSIDRRVIIRMMFN